MTTRAPEVEYAVQDGVAIVTLTAVHRRNALNAAMAGELVAAVERAERDPTVGALVVTGGAVFSAGADREVMATVSTDPSSDENFREIETIYASFVRLGAAAIPTVAAVRGPAIGGGLNLALAADLRVVAHDARFISGFTALGLHPGGGHCSLLHSLAGREATAALALFGAEIDGDRAVELGLAWCAVPDAEVERTALDHARRAARDPDLARRAVASMRLQLAPPGLSWAGAVAVERAPQMWSFRRWSAERAPKFSPDLAPSPGDINL